MNYIIPKHMDGCNCLEDLLVYAIQTNQGHYEYIFEKAWSFILNDFMPETYDENNRIGALISVEHLELEDMKEYCGIEVEIKARHHNENIAELFSKLRNHEMVILGMDGYYVPWNDSYQKIHFLSHYCMAIDIDEEEETITCIDPYFIGEKKEKLSFSGLYKGYSKFVYVKFHNANIIPSKEIIDSLIFKKCNLAKNISTDIEKYADIVENYLDFDIEFKEADSLWNTHIIMQTTSIINSRIQYAKYLEFLCKQYGYSFQNIILEFHKCSSEWNVLRALLFKGYYNRKNSSRLAIAAKIRDIAKIERKLYESFQTIFNAEKNVMIDNCKQQIQYVNSDISADCTSHKKQSIPISIEKYFNNKGFIKNISDMAEKNKNLQGIDHFNLFFLQSNAKTFSEMGKTWLSYMEETENTKDNISCMGQNISFSGIRCVGITLLGCSIYTSNETPATVRFADGGSDKFMICLPTSTSKETGKNCLLAVRANVKKLILGNFISENQEECLFEQTIYFSECNREVEGIILPDNINLHIFAVSVIQQME